MKAIHYTLIFFLINMTLSYGQNGSINAITGKKYTSAESIGDNNYAASFTFSKNKQQELVAFLDAHFDEIQKSNKKVIWKKLKGEYSSEDVFFVELKNRELKIEWKNTAKKSNQIVLDELKKIFKGVVEIIK